jgi:hypothetical protein
MSKEISMSNKVVVLKNLIATIFLNATELSIADGLQYKYKSYPYEDEKIKGWKFDIIVRQLGYPERTIQEFRFKRPANIEAKNMEFHVITEVLTLLAHSSLFQWYYLGLELNKDKELQEQIKGEINDSKKNIITSDK